MGSAPTNCLPLSTPAVSRSKRHWGFVTWAPPPPASHDHFNHYAEVHDNLTTISSSVYLCVWKLTVDLADESAMSAGATFLRCTVARLIRQRLVDTVQPLQQHLTLTFQLLVLHVLLHIYNLSVHHVWSIAERLRCRPSGNILLSTYENNGQYLTKLLHHQLRFGGKMPTKSVWMCSAALLRNFLPWTQNYIVFFGYTWAAWLRHH